jgi:hypothetical protein
MEMEVIDRLATVRVRVDHGSVSTIRKALLLRQRSGCDGESTDHRCIGNIIERCHMIARDEDDVVRGLRINVAERQYVRCLKYDFRRNLPRTIRQNRHVRSLAID